MYNYALAIALYQASLTTALRHKSLLGLTQQRCDSPTDQLGYKGGKTDIASMARDYLHNGPYRLALEMKKAGEELSEPNIGYLRSYSAKLGLLDRKPQTIARVVRELRYILPLLGKDAKNATKEDIEGLILQVNGCGKAPASRRKIKQTLKTFYRWLLGSEEYPSIVKWIKPGRVELLKMPDELLTEDEIAMLLGACRNQRDKTIISLLYDTGMRVGELLNLKVRDIVLNKDSPSYAMVDGKTGKRRVTLMLSVPYIANYLNDRVKERAPESALFLTNYDNPVDYANVRKILHDLKERSGIKKRIHPHLFRHSRATFYGNKMTEQQLKKYFGWAGGSQMAAVYVHLSGKDVDNAIYNANGITNGNVDSTKPKLTMKTCYKCHLVNEATARHCVNCGSPLDVSPVEQTEEVEKLKEDFSVLKSAITMLVSKLGVEMNEKIMEIIKD
jgi:site-specific recombinase XerD